jgi:tripartite-type tricarboxylate transporter receptor subunit TctC
MLNGCVATQEFPAHAIRLVIPYPPGGIVDAVGRGRACCRPLGPCFAK